MSDWYQKTHPVQARCLEREARVMTRDGEVTAAKGDWLLTDHLGESWVVPDAVFGEIYKRTEGPTPELLAEWQQRRVDLAALTTGDDEQRLQAAQALADRQAPQ